MNRERGVARRERRDDDARRSNGRAESPRGRNGKRNDASRSRSSAGANEPYGGPTNRARNDRTAHPSRGNESRTGSASQRGKRPADHAPRRPDRDERQLGEAARAAQQHKPADGWSLDDFDDIPMPDRHDDGRVRLQKALANAGVASRRVCEQYITEGRVEVNGEIVRELGSRIDPSRDRVFVNGIAVQFDQSKRYVILNKPTGVVSTMKDEHGRRDLREFTREWSERLYNVGRLDYETSGLLILTNDGELANVLAHPSYGVEKTYIAKVKGRVTAQTLQKLLRGIELEDGPIKIDSGKILADQPGRGASLVEVTLHSGRNRIVRRMFDAVGHPVTELVRRSFGPLHLGTLRAGESREVTQDELGKLLTLARRAAKRPEPGVREESETTQ